MKKVFNIIVICFVLLLSTNIVLFLVNGRVNYKELNKDITSIKKNGKIIYAKNKNTKKYIGNGYYILVTKNNKKINYTVYVNKRSIWEFTKSSNAWFFNL